MILLELFAQFALISLLAFGGGQAALPLVERIGVQQLAWVTPSAFAAAVAFSYLTPGPVLILATFIGYAAAGFPGAVAATLGVFLLPTLLAALTAAGVERLAQNRWLKAFGRGAAPAVVGLLGATAWSLGSHALSGWFSIFLAAIALIFAARTKLEPAWLLLGGALLGWLYFALGSRI